MVTQRFRVRKAWPQILAWPLPRGRPWGELLSLFQPVFPPLLENGGEGIMMMVIHFIGSL